MRSVNFLGWIGACALALGFTSSSFGAAVAPYNTAGFETPRFHVGLLDSTQDVASGANWQTSLSSLGATAQVTTFGDATQGVAVTLLDVAAGQGGYWYPQVPISPAGATVSVQWHMYVTNAAGPFAVEGDPFFGISAFDQSGARLATAGVNAANGAIAVSDSPSTTNEYTNPFSGTALNNWHLYRIDLNFTTKQFHVFINGTQIGTGFNFVTPTATNFGDADLNAFGLTNVAQTTGLAYFDNYVVVPESTMAAAALCGFAVVSARRRRRVK